MLFRNKNVHYFRTVKAGRLGFLGKQSQQQSKKHIQSGRSMIEMLGVLAIVGVLSAGGIAGYSMAMQSYKTTQLIEKTQLIAQTARVVYKGKYDGISIQNLINSGKISDKSNPFGGDFVIANSTWGPGMMFFIRLGALPSETCTDVLQTDWGSSGVFEGVNMTGHSFRYTDGTWPVSASDAIDACKGTVGFFDIVFK